MLEIFEIMLTQHFAPKVCAFFTNDFQIRILRILTSEKFCEFNDFQIFENIKAQMTTGPLYKEPLQVF
jgi:hypothetical protein